MTMETSHDHKASAVEERRTRHGAGDPLYGQQGRGAGLYAEVKPLHEYRVLTVDGPIERR